MPSPKKRGGLGRGLNALVSEAEYETGGSAASASNAASETKLPIEDIVPNPNQPRIHFNETELRELSESIQEHGVLQPLLVRKHGNGYEIIAGERRYQASKLAGLEELPVMLSNYQFVAFARSSRGSSADDLRRQADRWSCSCNSCGSV